MLTSEVKGQLAKLLATENLIVEHRNVETACFDVDKRILTLPIWNASDRVYNLLVGHEVGHALFTPMVDFGAEAPKSYVNVTEDARVEKLMKRKFPGLAKDFYHGYKQMNESDFFGIGNVEFEKLKLIDRINLHYKLGSERMMPFQNDDEVALREQVGAAETFQEAVDAARAIFEYEKNQQQNQQEEQPTNQKGNTTDQQINPNQGSSSTGDSLDEEVDSNSETPSSQSSDVDGNQDKSGTGGSDDFESLTDQNLKENLDNIASKDKYASPNYVEIPKVDLKYVIVHPKDVWGKAVNFWNDPAVNQVADFTRADHEFRLFKNECSREVSFLAKEFEMKKAASSFARESISRTGVLDTSKLHTYLYNEDIFKKITVRPDGKNHGLIFMLDWSGSMCENIHATYKQLLSLCIFCRKTGIPFDVYAFVTDAGYSIDMQFNYSHLKENDFCVPEHFHLLNLLNSKLNNAAFDSYAKYLWRITIMLASRYTDMRKDWQFCAQIPDCIPPNLYLGGTPLNEAVVCLKTLIPAFRQKNNVEKVHVSLLTDGEACWSQRWSTPTNKKYDDSDFMWRRGLCENLVIRNRLNGRTHNCTSSKHLTQTLLEYMKAEFPMCNFLGFRIATTRDFNYYLDASNLNTQSTDKLKKEWTKNKSCSAPILGFQEIYFMQSRSLEVNSEFEVSEDATKAQIKSAFQKSLKSKANNKKILSSFITQIA
jgi:hypothetical protein